MYKKEYCTGWKVLYIEEGVCVIKSGYTVALSPPPPHLPTLDKVGYKSVAHRYGSMGHIVLSTRTYPPFYTTPPLNTYVYIDIHKPLPPTPSKKGIRCQLGLD